MSTLAHVFEAAGIATIALGSVRKQIESTAPPRGLWCDFPLGRPLGKPGDAEFQHRVLDAAFALLDAEGPVFAEFAFIAVSTVDGYAVEAFVHLDELDRPDRVLAGGERIGLDLAVNISRDSNRQNGGDDFLGQYFLRIANGGSPWPYDNVSAFCTPELQP